MTAALIQAKGQAAANGLSPTLAITISASAALSALIASMFAPVTGSSRTFTSAGSTWTATDFDDASARNTSSAIPGATGTTTVTANNGGTNTDFTTFVAEFSGLKTAGTIQKTAKNNSTGTTWVSPTLVLTQDSLVICISLETGGSTQTSTTTGTGFTALAGTGITAGAVANSSEGDVMHISWGQFANGASVTGGGAWNVSVTQDAWLVAYELAPAGGGASDQTLLLML